MESNHRGRLQVQGPDMNPELSWGWAQKDACKAEIAENELSKLENCCSSRQLRVRDQAFLKARRFIQQARLKGGVSYPISTSYSNRNVNPNHRVDIEVIFGIAFVP